MMTDLTVEVENTYLPVNKSCSHQSQIGSHLHHLAKPLTCIKDDHAHQNHCLVSDFHLLLPALLLQHSHAPRPQTVNPRGSAKHIWNVPQDMAW